MLRCKGNAFDGTDLHATVDDVVAFLQAAYVLEFHGCPHAFASTYQIYARYDDREIRQKRDHGHHEHTNYQLRKQIIVFFHSLP